MKKRELENLQVGSIVEAYKGGEYTITKIEYEEEMVVRYELDNIKKVSPSTLQKNYKAVEREEAEAETEAVETVEQKDLLSLVEEQPTTEEQTTLGQVVAVQEIGVNPVGEMAIVTTEVEAKPEEVKPIETKEVKPVEVKPAKKAKKNNEAIEKLNSEVLGAVEELRNNINFIVEDKKGRIAIKLPRLDMEGLRARCIVDLVVNSRGPKVHIREAALLDEQLNEYMEKGMVKALPPHWALNLEVKIDTVDRFWELVNDAADYERILISNK